MRAKWARKRNDKLFLQRIAPRTGIANNRALRSADSWDLFPPRRLWHRYRPMQSERGQRSAFDLNVDTLFRAILDLRRKMPAAPWVLRLNSKVQELRSRALHGSTFCFGRPRIIPLEKDRRAHEYRPLAVFCREDKIIDALTARYLRCALDAALAPCCLAFRTGARGAPPPTIHDALEAILTIRGANPQKELYVAECDIRGFFDCVSHGVARSALQAVIDEVKRRSPSVAIDRRAIRILEAYLNSYSFAEDVMGRGRVELRKVDPKGRFKWPDSDLKILHARDDLPSIGVPQGGALSCLIANLVLHAADQRIKSICRKAGTNFLYMRYCDDMIIIAGDRVQCELAYQEYFDALLSLRLPVHPAKIVRECNESFFHGKSNAPYLWDSPARQGIPWIQFVGYQIRYDGLVRVRLKSLRKQFRKITSTADELLRALGRRNTRTTTLRARKTQHQILHRLRQRLIALSVGRIQFGQRSAGLMPMCWANGFRGLLGKNIIPAHLKAMDRQRERQLQRVARYVKSGLQLTTTPKAGVRKVLRFFGLPFSYWAQFQKHLPAVIPAHNGSVRWCAKCRSESGNSR